MLTPDNIQEFYRDGVTVIEDVFSEEEVEEMRKGFHNELLTLGIDHYGILNENKEVKSDVRIKGAPSKIFYNKWKIDAQLNERVYTCFKQLINATFSSGNKSNYTHPYGPSTDVLPMIDRVCWRLPDKIRAEEGLKLHMDRNPYDPYLLKSEGLTKWRPIQAFITLTDHYGSESGGLKVVKGFHNIIDDFFANKKDEVQVEEKGEFFRMISKSYAAIDKKCQPIIAKRGSIVCWDNRLPHKTSDILLGNDTREVIYISFLPDVALNRSYCKKQLEYIVKNIAPPAYLKDPKEIVDRNWKMEDLSEFQKKILGIVCD